MSTRDLMGWVEDGLSRLETEGLLRSLGPVEPIDAVRVRVGARTVTLFSSNDYLGLAAHPEVKRAAIEAVERHGMGPRGSPLICGYTEAHEALERTIASLVGADSVLLFPTGYAANLAVITSLIDEQTTIFSDALNHASIIDACRLAKQAGAAVEVYRHGDMHDLRERLGGCSGRKVIVSESVFSMDGDLAPLRTLTELADRHRAHLVLDESHATLVFGGGVAVEQGVAEQVDVRVGTLSKAAGALGGFAATSRPVRRWLLNRGRSYVFSTAVPVPVASAAKAAIEIAIRDNSLRSALWSRVEQLGALMGRPLFSPIVPIVLGDPDRVMRASRMLLDAGFHVSGVRPPTVPPDTARLRITLSAAHTEADVETLWETVGGLVA